jgi:hypothetical protein
VDRRLLRADGPDPGLRRDPSTAGHVVACRPSSGPLPPETFEQIIDREWPGYWKARR